MSAYKTSALVNEDFQEVTNTDHSLQRDSWNALIKAFGVNKLKRRINGRLE